MIKPDKLVEFVIDGAKLWLYHDDTFPKDKTQRKEWERRTTLLLFREVLNEPDLEIERLPSGKPLIKNSSAEISISHSNGYIALAYTEQGAIGIDVQVHTSKLDEATAYFLNEQETMLYAKASLKDLYLIWCAKEATYKLFEGKMTGLRDEVSVKLTNELTASYYDHEIRFSHWQNEEFTLVAGILSV